MRLARLLVTIVLVMLTPAAATASQEGHSWVARTESVGFGIAVMPTQQPGITMGGSLFLFTFTGKSGFTLRVAHASLGGWIEGISLAAGVLGLGYTWDIGSTTVKDRVRFLAIPLGFSVALQGRPPDGCKMICLPEHLSSGLLPVSLSYQHSIGNQLAVFVEATIPLYWGGSDGGEYGGPPPLLLSIGMSVNDDQ